MEQDHKAVAEQFFRGVYGGDPSVVDELAAEEIVTTYPIFERLFGRPLIRGREAVKDFATGFGSRWSDAHITIHEAVEEGDRVVLLWSFRGRSSGSDDQERLSYGDVHSWGGITLFRFDGSGKIVAEIGEESSPGPAGRLAGATPETPPQ